VSWKTKAFGQLGLAYVAKFAPSDFKSILFHFSFDNQEKFFYISTIGSEQNAKT